MGVCTTDGPKSKKGSIKVSKNISSNSNAEEPQNGTSIKDMNNKSEINRSINKSEIDKSKNKSEIKNDEPDGKEQKPKNEENFNINLPNTVLQTPENDINKDINYKIDKNNDYDYKGLFGSKKQEEIQDSNLPPQANAINNGSKNPEEEKENNINNNYEKFNNYEEYYLICPDCNSFITNIKQPEYDSDNKDFKVKYKCSCEEKNEKYLYSIISGEKPKCKEHNSDINFICESCNKQICEECKNKEHNTHQVKNVINSEIISDSINNIILEKKENFKGYDVFSKLIENYKISAHINKDSGIKKIDENQNELNKDGKNNIYFYNKKSSKEENDKTSQIYTNNGEVGDEAEKTHQPKEEINGKEQKDSDQPNSGNNNDNRFEGSNKSNRIDPENENKGINISINQNSADENPLLVKEKPQVRPPNDFNEPEKEIQNGEKIMQNNKIEERDIRYNLEKEEIDKEQGLLRAGKKDSFFMNKSNNEFNIGIDGKVDDKSSEKKPDNNAEGEINGKKDDDINKTHNSNMEQDNLEPKNKNNFVDKPLKKYQNTKTIIGHGGRIVCLIRLSSGYIATGSYDYSIKIWDITKDPDDSLIATRHSEGFIFCLLELKPNELLAGNSLNAIDVFDLNDHSDEIKERLFEHSLWISALVKCDENNFASASNDARIVIWDSNSKKKLRELTGHTDCILTMILLEDGRLCTGSADNNIIIWDWKNKRSLYRFKAHNNWVKTICQFNDQILLTGSDDHKIKIWNMNLVLLDELKEHEHSVRALCKIDDNFFASGSFDSTIKIWDINEKKCVDTLKGHNSNVICIIKYDDKLISCSNDKTIKIWEEI